MQRAPTVLSPTRSFNYVENDTLPSLQSVKYLSRQRIRLYILHLPYIHRIFYISVKYFLRNIYFYEHVRHSTLNAQSLLRSEISFFVA